MITIVHGDDQISSRNFFLEQKDKNSLSFDAENLNVAELKQEITGSSLFGPSNKIFIDNLFSRKASKNFEEILVVLNKKGSTDIYIWADKVLSAKELSFFPKSSNKLFKIPANIWSFLDGIKPGSLQNLLRFQNVITTIEPEFVFVMITRQFRLMIGLIGSSGTTIDEVKRLAPWQISKLTRQASLFGIDKLKMIYKKLYKIEKSLKSGKSNLTLTQHIDILLLEI